MVQIFWATTGSHLHLSSLKCVIPKVEITRVAIAEVGWDTVQEFWLGNSKLRLKKVSKSASVLKCHFLFPAKRLQGDICHIVFITRNVKGCKLTALLGIDT